MAQSSPEGIVLGKGSTLVKMELSVSEKQQTDILEMGQITEKEETIQDIASEYHSVAYGKLIKELTDGETTADYIDRHIVQAMVDIAKEQPKYPIGGYAPGNYSCSCSTCKKEFIGDKRAVQCEPCAISMTKEGNGLEFAKARRMQGSSTVNAMLMDEIGQFRFGKSGKWQEEQDNKMYSEKEVLHILHNYRNHFELHRNLQVLPNMFFEWFEQFKKK